MMAKFEQVMTRTVDATLLKVEAGVRYWEDGEVNSVKDEYGDLIPCRRGDAWCPIIEIDTGTIRDWPSGVEAEVHYKVCDAGTYSLIDVDGEVLKRLDGYVPSIMSPGGDGYGDYIIMSIDGSGRIEGWRADLDDFSRDTD